MQKGAKQEGVTEKSATTGSNSHRLYSILANSLCLPTGYFSGCRDCQLGKENSVLAGDSLAETLWRLEEIRCGFIKASEAQTKEAIDWVLSRQGLKDAYRGLFAPTEKDLRGVKLLTGEPISSAALRHILGEEALRTVIVWNLGSAPAAKKAASSFNDILKRTGEPPAEETGWFCCHKCTIAFLRTLATVRSEGWKTTVQKGVENIGKKRTPDGKWHGFPFYYTLLTLSEIDLPSAKAELRHARPIAGKLMKRYQKNDRTSRLRKMGLEEAMTGQKQEVV